MTPAPSRPLVPRGVGENAPVSLATTTTTGRARSLSPSRPGRLHRHRGLPFKVRHRVGLQRRHPRTAARRRRTAPRATSRETDRPRSSPGRSSSSGCSRRLPPTTRAASTSPTSTSSPKPASPPAVPRASTVPTTRPSPRADGRRSSPVPSSSPVVPPTPSPTTRAASTSPNINLVAQGRGWPPAAATARGPPAPPRTSPGARWPPPPPGLRAVGEGGGGATRPRLRTAPDRSAGPAGDRGMAGLSRYRCRTFGSK